MPRTVFTTIILDPANRPQIEYWAKEFKVTASEVKAAIVRVGCRLTNVRSYLGKTADIIILSESRAKIAEHKWTAFPPVA